MNTPAGWPPPVTGSLRDATATDIDALYRRLTHSYGPPTTTAGVYAQALAAALYQAMEEREIAGHALRRLDARFKGGGFDDLLGRGMHHGTVMLANRVIRRVFDAVTPGKGVDPGHRLATRRALFGFTQSEVATAGRVERSHYARIENGTYRLKPDHAKLFAGLLECPPGYLLTGEGGAP